MELNRVFGVCVLSLRSRPAGFENDVNFTVSYVIDPGGDRNQSQVLYRGEAPIKACHKKRSC